MSYRVIINENHEAFSFGRNDFGQLGVGDFKDRWLPTEVKGLPLIVGSSTAYLYTLFLDENGFVWFCGRQIDETGSINVPVRLDIQNIVKISSGSGHSLLLDNKGNVFAVGRNDYGQLGLGHRHTAITPTKITGLPQIRDMFCGIVHSLLIDTENNCWSFGFNDDGELGLGDRRSRTIPTKIEGIPPIYSADAGCFENVLVDAYGCCYVFGTAWEFRDLLPGNLNEILSPIKFDTIKPIKYVSCGTAHTVFVDDYNEIYGFGSNERGQLGFGRDKHVPVPTKLLIDFEVSHISAHGYSTLIINTDGECFTCGSGESGALGLGDNAPRNTFENIKNFKADLSVYGKKFRAKSARN